MKILNTILLIVTFVGTAYLISCSDDTIAPVDDTQARADSLAQSVIDNDSIDWYIQFHNIPLDSIHVDTITGVRYAVLERGTGIAPQLNDILSIHYTGRFLEAGIFDTSNEEVAKLSDSLAYVDLGTSFDDLLATSDKTYEQILDSLSNSDGAISRSVFTINRSYRPIVFNQTTNGNGIVGFINGFRIGLNSLLNLKDTQGNHIFELGGKGIIFIPSADAYGTIGDISDPDLEDNIPPNTTLIFEFDFVNIRN